MSHHPARRRRSDGTLGEFVIWLIGAGFVLALCVQDSDWGVAAGFGGVVVVVIALAAIAWSNTRKHEHAVLARRRTAATGQVDQPDPAGDLRRAA